ncbi:diaminopimelate epimerase [Georgenia sp. Z1491]|uniref:diaminopimelate epimerase n=1 Tax=Georgenia sp. Z1491 TaxID=3416707 RepID=UPI003CE97A20
MTPDDRRTALNRLRGTTVTLGHGTENDFVLLDDPDAATDLTPEQVRALADRRGGIGGDGVIRVVRTEALAASDPAAARIAAEEPGVTWFMDYRNADGSVAEMCGNGVRVFVAHLRDRGHVRLEHGQTVRVGTRGGVREVRLVGEEYAVAMGRFGLPGGDRALAEGTDVAVVVPGLPGTRGGLRVTMPNPHTVVALPSTEDLAGARLALGEVEYAPEPPEGTNLELVVPGVEEVGAHGRVGTLTMRVLERGVGETRSCGTGCCAAAVAVRAWAGAGAPDRWRVSVPGGTVHVDIAPDGEVTLTGPAVLLGDLTLR